MAERADTSRPWLATAPAGRSPAPLPPDTADRTALSGLVPRSTVPSGAAPPAASQEREEEEGEAV
jgi:hypothetical protein